MPWAPLLVAVLAGTAPEQVTVAELFWGLNRYDTHTVRAIGWLGPCDRKICWLTDGAMFTAGVTLAASDDVDALARRKIDAPVVIEGLVRAECRAGRWSRDAGENAACLSKNGKRVGVLANPRIIVTTISR